MQSLFLTASRLGGLFGQSNRNRARTFLALADLILDDLAFAELFDTGALNFGVVEKQIAPFSFNESKTLFRQHFLNLTFWHCCLHKN